jgi:serine/threonine-protein kinase
MSDTMQSAPAERVLRGRFRLIRELGSGGMGTVWEAVEVATNRRYAIKFLRADVRSAAHSERLLREARAVTTIRHPNVLCIHEVIEDALGAPALVMDLLHGETLRNRLERQRRLHLSEAATILASVASGVQAAHAAGVVHRDLKPENIFIRSKNDATADVLVLDFGIAKNLVATGTTVTGTGEFLGTPYYMSPEQASGEKVDERSDVWSLGVILFECLTGQRPVEGENVGQIFKRLIRGEVTLLSSLRLDLPADLVQVVDATLAERSARPRDLHRLIEVLAQYADGTVPALASRPPVGVSGEAALAETVQVLKTTIPKPNAGRAPARNAVRWIGIGVLFVAVGGPLLWLGAHRRSGHARTDASLPIADSASRTNPVSELSAQPLMRIAETPSAAATPVETTHDQTPKRHVRPAGGRPGSTPASSSERRLQGGVAADVPF